MNKLFLICLIPAHLFAQVGSENMVNNDQIFMDEVEVAAHYSSPAISNEISVYPHVLKKNQEFVVDFNYLEGDPYEIEVRDSAGGLIEMIYSSQLSVFKAKNSITVQIHTPLETGLYYVVLNSKNVKIATKLLKFDGN